MKILLILFGVALLIGLAVAGFFVFFVGPSFCDLVSTLNAALVVGEAVWDAIKEFVGGVTDSMIDALPVDAQTPARALVELAKTIANLAFERLLAPFLTPITAAVGKMSAVCAPLS